MDKEPTKLSVKKVLTDRPLLVLMSVIVLAGVLYCLIVGLSIRQSDVMVYTRYSAFGEAHFYKDHWQYMLTFVLFGVVVAVGHIVLMLKLFNINRRQTAMLVGWLGVGILIVALVYALAVMSLGRAA